MVMTTTRQRLTERTADAASSVQRVDRDAGIIFGVKIAGEKSRNGRQYTAEALRRAAPLYEGVKCYIDHPKRDKLGEDRSVRECVGVFENVRYREGKGLYGDLKLRKASSSFEEMLEIATNFSSNFGLSHVAGGKSRREGGIDVVYEIEEVYSVDLVTDPATTAGLYESNHLHLSTGFNPNAPASIAMVDTALNRLAPMIVESIKGVYLRGRGTFPTEQTALLVQVVESATEWAQRNAANTAHAGWVSRCMLESVRNIIEATNAADNRESSRIAEAELDHLKLTIEAMVEGQPLHEVARYSEHLRKYRI